MFTYFLIAGIFFGLFYVSKWGDIFLFAPDKDKEKYEEERRRANCAPAGWVLEHAFHTFSGVLIGWLLFWYLIDVRLQLFSSPYNITPQVIDLGIFVFSIIGIYGKLPSIAHAVQDWFKEIPKAISRYRANSK